MQGNAEKGAEEEERRRDEGSGEGAKEVAREEERRRNEGTGDGANMILKCVQHEVGAAPSVT